MRILSDFDGVWTDQSGEAAAIQAWYADEAAKLIGIDRREAREDFASFRAATLADPARHGWWPRGYLTAFVDEDELLATGAVSYWLDNCGDDDRAKRWLAALEAGGFENAEAFGNAMFEPAMRDYRARGAHSLVPEAEEVVGALRARGVDLVIVSNSPTDKLESMFAEAGIAGGDGLRFVGDARKWWIASHEPTLDVGGRSVHVDRPLYRSILEEERPDLVIGDVASLDLAAPAAMRREGALSKELRLLLRDHAVASPWARSQVDQSIDERLVDQVVPSITALLQ